MFNIALATRDELPEIVAIYNIATTYKKYTIHPINDFA